MAGFRIGRGDRNNNRAPQAQARPQQQPRQQPYGQQPPQGGPSYGYPAAPQRQQPPHGGGPRYGGQPYGGGQQQWPSGNAQGEPEYFGDGQGG